MKAYIILIAFVIFAASIQGGILENRRKSMDTVFDRMIERIMAENHIPSMVAGIIKDGKLQWMKGYGLYDIERNKHAGNDTIYLVASISKSITATAIMQLKDKGLLNLDDDINKFLPFSVRNPYYPDKPITFRMLLSHTSSLSVDPPAFYCYFPGDLEIKGYPYPWLKEYLVPEGIHYKPDVWSDALPGEKMQYANVGYSLLGYLVEIISGESFEEYCQNHIFKPLNMNNSSFFIKNLNISRMAVPYEYNRKYIPLLHYAILDYPAGGLRTTVSDLSHFLIAHMNNGVYNGRRILSKESVEEMQSIHSSSGRYMFYYGYGFQIWKIGGDTYIGHTGGLYGVATKMVYRKSDHTGVIFFMNKEVKNMRDVIAFSMIERLLFLKSGSIEPPLEKIIEANKCLMELFP